MSPPAVPAPRPADPLPGPNEIRIYSHSSLFYWWPVWFFGFLFTLITWIDAGRLAIVDHDSLLIKKTMVIKDKETKVFEIVSPTTGTAWTRSRRPTRATEVAQRTRIAVSGRGVRGDAEPGQSPVVDGAEFHPDPSW